MKFSCERCGKKYATAEPPAAGKVYKLKCKGCGHLIVIRVPGTADVATGTPLPGQGSAATRPGAPAPARRGNGAPAGAPQVVRDDTSRVSIAAATPAPATAPAAVRAADPGYVDLFADLSAPEAGGPVGSPKEGDALRAAARASLPEAYQGVADPLAPLADAAPGAALPVPQVPEIAAPPRHRSTVLVVLIGVGLAVVAGILAFVLLGSGARAPRVPQRQPPAATDRGEQAPPPQGAQPGR